jgi:hypothetical protein
VKMTNGRVLSMALVAFFAGIAVANLPGAIASSESGAVDLSKRTFIVSIDEIRQNFVFGDKFEGSYSRTVTMSDGSKRTIKLTPMIHNGKHVVEFGGDSGGVTYMGLNGTTTNGRLMVQVRDLAEAQRQMKEQGWQF